MEAVFQFTTMLFWGMLLAIPFALIPVYMAQRQVARRLSAARRVHAAELRRLEGDALDATFRIDEQGIIRSFNHAAERLFGFQHSEIVGLYVGMLLPAANGAQGASLGLNTLHAAPRTANGIGLEVTGLRKNGASIPLDLQLTEVTDRGRRLFHAIARDLTDRRQSEGQTRQLRFLDGLLRSVGAPVIVLEQDGRIAKCNHAFEQLAGYSEAEAGGRYYWELLLHADEWSRAKVSTAQVIAANQTEKIQIAWRTKSGADVPMMLAMTALRAGNAAAEQAVIVGFPAPEMPAGDHGSPAMEAVERLAGGIAQQFNNLLTSINGYSELVLNSLDEKEPARRDVEEIKRAGERAAALTHQLLVFSRKQPMRIANMNLNDLVAGMKPMLGMLLGDRIQISTVLDLALANIEADPGWMEQVILNVAVNARDAMPKGGKLTIETANESMDTPAARRVAKLPAGEYVVLTMTDSGCGIDPRAHAHVFEPFFTGDRSKGMGLGLSTVYGVVRQAGGNVVFHSIPGSGTSVKIFLPRCAEAAAPPVAELARGLFLVRGAGAGAR